MTIKFVGEIPGNKTGQRSLLALERILEQLHVLIEARVNFIAREDLKYSPEEVLGIKT